MASDAVYFLCALTSLACAVLLLRAYRRGASKLLLWAGVCFCWFTLNNILLVVDRSIFPTTVDLTLWRTLTAFAGISCLLFGLIWEGE